MPQSHAFDFRPAGAGFRVADGQVFGQGGDHGLLIGHGGRGPLPAGQDLSVRGDQGQADIGAAQIDAHYGRVFCHYDLMSAMTSWRRAAGMAPARTRRGGPPVTSTMVEGRPPGQGPASRIRSTPAPNSRATSAGRRQGPVAGAVGAGAGHRQPQGRHQPADQGLAGLAHPDGAGAAGKPPGQVVRAGKIRVRGPGQNAAINREAVSGTSRAT